MRGKLLRDKVDIEKDGVKAKQGHPPSLIRSGLDDINIRREKSVDAADFYTAFGDLRHTVL